jgi:hypothetical protein
LLPEPDAGSAADGAAGRRLRTARGLSALLVVVATWAATAGLWGHGTYRDPEPVAVMYRGYDAVVLGLVVPLLVLVLLPAVRESVAGQLTWLGILVYGTYHYANVVFGTALNDIFLVQVTAFSLSVYALALGLTGVDRRRLAAGFRPRTPVRAVSVLVGLVALGLAGMWVFGAVRFAITGVAPTESLLVLPPANQHLGFVLDLALLVPAMAVAAVLLWRRTAWGLVLTTALVVFNLLYQVNYLTALVFQSRAGIPGASAFDPGEVPIVAVLLGAAVALFGNLRPRGTDPHPPVAR